MSTLTAEQYNAMAAKSTASKYGNVKVEEDGYTFDSKAEHRRYLELKRMLEAGEIGGLEVHPRLNLVVNSEKICAYIPDFRYCIPLDNGDAREVLEDVKSSATITPVYRLKKKLIKACYGIDVIEVTA